MQRFGTFLFASAVLSFVLIMFGDKVAPLGRLPGDDILTFGGLRVPIVSCLAVSGVLSLLTSLVRLLRGGGGARDEDDL